MSSISSLFVLLAIIASVNAASPIPVSVTCPALQSKMNTCWTASGLRRRLVADADMSQYSSVCACFNEFDFRPSGNLACTLEETYKYEAYLKNSCKLPAAAAYTAPALTVTTDKDVLKLQNTPCLQTCAAGLANPADTHTVAEICGAGADNYADNMAPCKWDERYVIAQLKTAGQPSCQFTDACMTAATGNSCWKLEQCQTTSCTGADETMVETRRKNCACTHGYVKSPNMLRCDAIEYVTAKISGSMDIITTESKADFDADRVYSGTNKSLKTMIREQIAKKIWPSEDVVNSVTWVTNVQSTTKTSFDIKYLDITCVTASDSECNNGFRTKSGVGLGLTYDIMYKVKQDPSIVTEAGYSQIAFHNVGDVLAADTFRGDMTSALNGFSIAVTTGKPAVPTISTVGIARSPVPSAAPSAAPTVRDDYVSSPIVMFGIAGAAAVVAFLWFVNKHNSPEKDVKEVVKKTTNPAAGASKKPAAKAAAGASKKPEPKPVAVVERA
jgi:hypothetical protein